MSHRTSRPVASTLAAAAVALPALSLAATPALAAPPAAQTAKANTYEQISRGNGPAGPARLDALLTPVPLFASDTGVTAGYNADSRSNLSLQIPLPTTTLRNTVTNQSRSFGADRGQLVATDRTEQIGLFQRVEKLDGYTYARKYAVGRVDGSGTLRQVEAGDADTVRLSGNGRFVITAGPLGLRRLELASGMWTTLAPLAFVGRAAVSEDGQTVAGLSYDQQAQRVDAVVWRGTKATTIITGYNYRGPGSEPQLSPDASVVFTMDPGQGYPDPTVITARKLASGRTTTTNVPFQATYDVRPIWVAPDGDQIAFALNYQDAGSSPLEPAQVWTVGKGWKPFGGAFATSLMNDGTTSPASAVSRNGKYAAIAYNDQVALVSLDGTPLPGNPAGKEGLAATSYFDTPGLDYCGFGFSSQIIGSYTRPAFWAPAPPKARIVVGNGTTTLQQADWTKPLPYPHAGNVDADFINVSFPLGTAHTRTLDLTVVDGDGRTLREQQTATVTCGATN